MCFAEMNANDTIDFSAVPLSSLTYESRNVISYLLNTKKVLPSDGPIKLPRDWRGLASLVNISSEVAHCIEENDRDKTARVLEIWMQKKDDSATVGKLLEYTQRLDRYDLFDDIVDLATKGKLVSSQTAYARPRMEIALNEEDNELLTFDDKIHGAPQFYHAYVLFAQEDRNFVDEMIDKMAAMNLKLCTEEDLLPDHVTAYAPVSKLISSDRCHRIILVYSPDFLESPANGFYMDYAQAVGIEMKKPKIIPVMYRNCQLPAQVMFYHKLYYQQLGNKNSYDFWERLGFSLTVMEMQPNIPRLNGANTTSSLYSGPSITEVESITNGTSTLLALPSSSSSKSISMNSLNSMRYDSKSLSNISETSEGRRKKPNIMRKLINNISKKGKKKPKEDGAKENGAKENEAKENGAKENGVSD